MTLRDHDEATLLRRLETLLQRYPVAQAPAPAAPEQAHGDDWCSLHRLTMKQQRGKDGSTWFSHKTADGWCKGKERRHG